MATSDCVKSKTGKKVSKPLMEKKRRARINKSLDQLKSLLETHYSSNIRKRKLEKADILELTVKHLTCMQKVNAGSPVNSGISDYQAGFRSCLAGVNQYLLMSDNSNGSSRLCMLTHLSSNLLGTGGGGLKSSTTDSDLGKHRAEEATRRRIPSAAEATKAQSTAPFTQCVRSRNPTTTTAHVSHSRPMEITGGERLSSGASQAHTQTTREKKSLSLLHKNKDIENKVAEILSQDVWRPW